VVSVCTWIWPKVSWSAGRFRTRSLFSTWPSSSRFGFRVLEYRSCTSQVWHVTQSPAAYLKALADWTRAPAIDLSNNMYTFIVTFFIYFLFFFAFFYRALAALGFGSSLPFCAKKRSSLLHESEGILCCFARKASVHCYESTTTILMSRGSFPCQQYF
jgi:hypothetical protein